MAEEGILSGLFERSLDFRGAAADLVRLEPEKLQRIAELTDESFDVANQVADEFGIEPERLQDVIRAAHTLHDVAQVEPGQDANSILDQLGRLFADSDLSVSQSELKAKRASLLQVIESTPGRERYHERRRVQDSFLPVLERVSMTVDLRPSEDEDTLLFVPVVIARMSFDETVGGTDHIVFQLGDDSLTKLAEIIREIEQDLDRVRRQMRENLL